MENSVSPLTDEVRRESYSSVDDDVPADINLNYCWRKSKNFCKQSETIMTYERIIIRAVTFLSLILYWPTIHHTNYLHFYYNLQYQVTFMITPLALALVNPTSVVVRSEITTLKE